jgi:WD40 repeat protein
MIALHGHQGRVWSASFSPDGARIVTASEDCTARIWDATAAREINAVRGHQDWV